jgi:hypothetical protein
VSKPFTGMDNTCLQYRPRLIFMATPSPLASGGKMLGLGRATLSPFPLTQPEKGCC